jgi:activator of 2-hydroxyglutaryl-CoA dehydratase
MPSQRTAPVVVGIDVGSTTVKAVVLDPDSREMLWSDYQRHQTKQPEKVYEFLQRIEAEFPISPKEAWRVFMTGSGAMPLCPGLGAKFVQEVNAVTLAVETQHPDVGSIIELGGQDAKIIIFKTDEKTGDKTASPSMNDKCASGTGATIDKCMIKVGLPQEQVGRLHFDDSKLHHVAAKCGVFAETDIVNLVKSGIPAEEILCSLADAIVLQNLSVLTRGSTLRHKVLLLGGPKHVPALPAGVLAQAHPRDLGRAQLRVAEAPAHRGGHLRARKRAVLRRLWGLRVRREGGPRGGRLPGHQGPARLHDQRPQGAAWVRARGRRSCATWRRSTPSCELYAIPKYSPRPLEPGSVVRGVIGLDGGSTSSKAVLVDEEGEIVCKAYQLSKGNPLQDTKELLTQLRDYVKGQGATLDLLGFGATGYAADVLQETLRADVNIVETVAHMMSAVKFFGDVDVICDIGGQDIKVLFMKNGDIANFRLSNSCSAGNGMLLQAMADQFGLDVTDYAETAFAAELAPKFSYGCARVPRHRPGQLPEGGLLARRAARGARPGAAEKRLAVRRADSAYGSPRHPLRAPGRHPVQPRRRQGAGRLHQGARAQRRRCLCILTRARRARLARPSRRSVS